ncbi:MAG: SPOR domain-containing protein [Prevotellaceae bacterium]|nr:SPOR domain-containing protein [Prevotellaceae bacterium]
MSNFALVIELDRHIEILLLDNDCVIIPNFGGFVTHYVDARYDESEGSFLPPLRTLGYNPHLKNINDSLLAQSYVEAYDISYPEAQRKIAEEVDNLKTALSEQGQFELKNIGMLSLNDMGDVVFEPCEAGILTPDLYGLGSFEMPKLADASTASPQPATAAEPFVLSPIQPADDFAKPDKQSDELEANGCDSEPSERTISIKVSWLRNIAVAAAAIVAFFFLSTPVTNSIEGKLYVSDMGTGLLTKISELDTPNNAKAKASATIANEEIKATVAKKVVEKAKSDSLKTAGLTKAEKPESTDKPLPAYCIVMASQVTKSGAENFVKTLKAEGYDQAYTYINNNVVRVVYGRYPTEQQAYNKLKIVRGNKYFEQAWIYKMTH